MLFRSDLIIKISEDEVNSPQDLPGILRQRRPGDKIDVTVKRGDKEVKLEVTLSGPPRNG